MNERIFELAKQADLIQWDTLPSGARTPDHESVVKAKKFAQLVAKECAVLAMTEHHSTSPADYDEMEPYEQGCDDTASAISGKIRRIFGVE